MNRPLDKQTFALALQMHQERLGLTQAEAAELLKVDAKTYWQWLKALSNPLYPTMFGALEILKSARKK